MLGGRTGFALAAAAAMLCVGLVAARAEPLVSQGIGTSHCGRLANDLRPGEGLTNPVNLMLYSWVQGYVSAANISLLEAAPIPTRSRSAPSTSSCASPPR